MVCILGKLCRGPLTHSVSLGNRDCQSVRESPPNDPDDDVQNDMPIEEMRASARECLAAKQAADEKARRAELRQRLAKYRPDPIPVVDFEEWQLGWWRKMAQEILAEQKAAAENANGSGESH